MKPTFGSVAWSSAVLALASVACAPAGALAEPMPGEPRTSVIVEAAQVTSALRRLAAGPEGIALEGEVASVLLPLVVPASEAGRAAELRLAFSSAISVDPQLSRLTVAVNDVLVGEVALGGGGAPRRVALPIPDGLLAHGANAVRLTALHTHRVDCTEDAVFELWTRLDPSESGLAASTSVPVAIGPADLGVAVPGPDGTLPIRVSGVDLGDDAVVESVFSLAQAIARNIGHPAPRVVLGDAGAAPWGPLTDHGVRIRLGASADATRLGPRGGVEMSSVARDAGAIAALAEIWSARADAPPPGTAAGLRARDAALGHLVEEHATPSLADLGGEDRIASRRVATQDVRLRLPADFYPADFDHAVLTLHAAWGAGLAQTSAVEITVNDRVLARVPLGQRAGGVLAGKRIPIPLSAFEPGQNRVRITARLPLVEETCANDGRERFFLSAERTTLRFPRFARAVRLPDLSAVAAGVHRHLGEGVAAVHLPDRTHESLAAAMSFLARAALVGDAPVAVRLAGPGPAQTGSHALVVTTADAAGGAVFRGAGLDESVVRAAWVSPPEFDTALSTQALRDLVLTTGSLGRPGVIASPIPAPSVRPASQLASRLDQADAGFASERLLAEARTAVATLIDRTSALVHPRRGDPGTFDPGDASDLLVAQALAGAEGSTTLVLARDSAALDRVGESLGRGDHRIAGAIAAFERDGGVVRTGSADTVGLVFTRVESVSDVRLAAAALIGENPLAYTGASLACLLVFAFVSHVRLRRRAR